MRKRFIRLLLIGVLALSTIMPSAVSFASETSSVAETLSAETKEKTEQKKQKKQDTEKTQVSEKKDTGEKKPEAKPSEEKGAGETAPDKGKTEPETQAPETQAPETQAPETQAPETQAPETQAPETQAPETQAPETQAPETQAPETQAPETQAPETQAPETQAPETQAPETQAPETQAPETQAPETQAPETQAPETQAPETQAPETQAPETQAPETQAPETQAPETQAPETQAPETQAPETQVPETQAPEKETEMATEAGTEPGTEERETEKDKEDKKDKDRKDKEEEKDDPSIRNGYGTNERLIAHQNIIMPETKTDFRFIHVPAEEVDIILIADGSLIREEKSAESRAVGAAEGKSCAFVLADADGEWVFVESKNVRGFVHRSDTLTGDMAEKIYARDGEEAYHALKELISATENKAYCYTHTTTAEVVVPKKFAVARDDVSIFEKESRTGSRVVGTLAKNGLAYILADVNGSTYFVESGDVRGFADKGAFKTGRIANSIVHETSEGNMEQAECVVKPESNQACYYTLTSIKEADNTYLTRKSMVDFALQFVGNPYVWGGTSLTNGADCSGFVQSIYAYYGYSLPRVACDQAGCGTQVPVSAAQPGDLIFYAQNGYVYHVSMYIGNGQVVQAANSRRGIITSGIGGDAVWAANILG